MDLLPRYEATGYTGERPSFAGMWNPAMSNVSYKPNESFSFSVITHGIGKIRQLSEFSAAY